MAALLTPSFVTDCTFMKTTEDDVACSVPLIERPAKFWYGASLPFRVEESINILNAEIPSCNFYKAIGILHDVSIVIAEAFALVGCVDKERLTELQENFSALSGYVQQCFHNYLLAAKSTRPEKPLTEHSVQAWFNAIQEFIKISEPFAIDWDYVSSWKALQQDAIRNYQTWIKQFASNGAVWDSSDGIRSQSSKTSPPVFRFEMAGKYLIENSTTDEVLSVFNSIVDFYKYWCRQAASKEHIKKFSIHFDTLRRTIETLLIKPPYTQKTLKDKHIDERSQLIYEGWCNHFRQKFGRFMVESLAERQSRMEVTIDDEQNLETAERQLYSLARDFCEASFMKPDYVCKRAWSEWSPYLVSPEIHDAAMLRLQQISNVLQLRLSATCEVKRLFFDLYKSLAITYMILDGGNFESLDTEFPLENRFFLDTAHRKRFGKIMSETLVSNPMAMEDIVAQYCIAIAHARMGTCLEEFNVRLYSTNELKHTEKRINDAYHQNLVWTPAAIRVMQKMAVRLNHLTGGPAYIRRAHPELKYWHIDLINLDMRSRDTSPSTFVSNDEHSEPRSALCDRLPSKLRAHSGRVRFALDTDLSDDLTAQNAMDFEPSNFTSTIFTANQAQAQSRTTLETLLPTIRLTAVDTSSFPMSRRLPPQETAVGFHWKETKGSITKSSGAFAEPFGFNAVSSFDFVNCPFPESRTIEVATGHQMSRELSDRNIVSLGPRVEDVINRPPQHTQAPGKTSAISQYLPYGPWNLLKKLWQTSKQVKSARSRRSITPRYQPRLAKKKQGGILSLQKDAFRVTKSKNSQSQTPRVPRLRGGGGSEPHTDEPVSVLKRRTTAFWHTHTQPTTLEYIERFLEPAGWDVERAYLEIQRLYGPPDDGVIDPTNLALGTQPATTRNDQATSIAAAANSLLSGGESFKIYVDPSQRTQPASRQSTDSQAASIISRSPGSGYVPASSNVPAGNQEHQRQRDEQRLRQKQGLPPRQIGDNSSNIENRPVLGSLSVPDSQLQSLAPHPHVNTCATISCHRCPVFAGQFHHVCTGLDANIRVASSQPLTNRDSPLRSVEEPANSQQNPHYILSDTSSDNQGGSSSSRQSNSRSNNSANHSANRSSSHGRSRSKSEIPDSQDKSVLDLSQAPARNAAATNNMPRTSITAALTPGISATRITRRKLAQMNAQRTTKSPLSIARARAQIQSEVDELIQEQRNIQTQGQGTNPVLIGIGSHAAPPSTPATRPVVPNPVTPPHLMIPRTFLGPSNPNWCPSPSTSPEPRPARPAGRGGRWRASSSGSPNSLASGEAGTPSPPSKVPFSKRPPILFPPALGPQTGATRGTGPDFFVSPFRRTTPARAPASAMSAMSADDLSAAASAALHVAGTGTHFVFGAGPTANANADANANAPASRRAGSNPLPTTTTSTGTDTATNTNTNTNSLRAASDPREVTRRVPSDFGGDGPVTRSRRGKGPKFWTRYNE